METSRVGTSICGSTPRGKLSLSPGNCSRITCMSLLRFPWVWSWLPAFPADVSRPRYPLALLKTPGYQPDPQHRRLSPKISAILYLLHYILIFTSSFFLPFFYSCGGTPLHPSSVSCQRWLSAHIILMGTRAGSWEPGMLGGRLHVRSAAVAATPLLEFSFYTVMD